MWGLSDEISIYVYRGVLGLQLFLAAIGIGGLVPTFFNTPTLEYVTWIEILFVTVAVITTMEAILAGYFVLWSIHPNEKAFIPRYRIIFAIIIAVTGIALLVRTIMLSEQGVPECSTTTDRKGKTGKIVEEQEPCQAFFNKCVICAAALVNCVLYAVTAIVDPHKAVYGTNSAGGYGNVGVVYNSPQNQLSA